MNVFSFPLALLPKVVSARPGIGRASSCSCRVESMDGISRQAWRIGYLCYERREGQLVLWESRGEVDMKEKQSRAILCDR